MGALSFRTKILLARRRMRPSLLPQTSVDVVVKDTGHGTMNVNFPAESPSTITVAGKAYTLLQCHFHTSSEHTVEGVSYLGEAHFVHQVRQRSLLSEASVASFKGANSPRRYCR